MSDHGNAALLQRIQTLEAENRALRTHIPASTDPAVTGNRLTGSGARVRTRGWGWTLLATVLIVVGATLAPLAVVASWARVVLTDTDRFVATYAPLADDPAIQEYITAQTLVVINEQVDIPALTSDVIDGITSLGTGPRATAALNLLNGPAASGIQTLIQNGVSAFVASDAFGDVWASALRVSHTQLVAAMENDPDAAIALASDGTIGIQLGPILEAAKTALLAQGIDFAAEIPAIDRTIVVAQSDALPTAQLAYGLAISAGDWLPWLAILALVLGALVARRRSVPVIGAAAALAVSMALLAATFEVGRSVFVSSAGAIALPAGVASLLYEAVTDDMRATTIAVLVLAIGVAIVGWMSGPSRLPRRVRGVTRAGAAHIRDAAARRGMTTGRTGTWLYAQHVLVRVVVGAIAAAIVVFVRPLTPASTLWTLLAVGVLLTLLEVAQRPPADQTRDATELLGEDRPRRTIPVESSTYALRRERG